MIPKTSTRLISICLAAAVSSTFLSAAAGPILDGLTDVVETLREDGTTNRWTQADLVEALGLLNRRYWRDMATDAGRRAWHGAVTSSSTSTVTNGEAVCIVRRDVFSDGFAFAVTSAPKRVREPLSTADQIARRDQMRADRIAALQAKVDAFAARLPPAHGASLDERLAYGRAAVASLAAQKELERLTNAVQTLTLEIRPPDVPAAPAAVEGGE